MSHNSGQVHVIQPRSIDLYSPVEVVEIHMEIDRGTGTILAKPVLFNVSDQVVTALKVQVTCYDSFGALVSSQHNPTIVNIQDEKSAPKALIAAHKAIDLTALPDTRIADILVVGVAFADGSFWEKGTYPLVIPYKQVRPEALELRALGRVAGAGARGYSHVSDIFWLCVCGRHNALSEPKCLRCTREKITVINQCVSTDSVSSALLELDKQRKVEEERQVHIAAEETRALKDKNRKLLVKALKLSPILLLLFTSIALGAITDWTFSYRHYELGRLNTPDANGNTSLHRAIIAEDQPLAISLIDKDVSIEVPNSRGETPLILAASMGHLHVVGALLQQSALLEHSVDGLTAVMHAALAGHADVVQVLLRHGAKPAPVTRVNLNHTSLTVSKGNDSGKLVADVSPHHATDKAITWTSSNLSVATVDGQGVVTPVSQGQAVITAQAQGGSASATCVVDVIIGATGVELSASLLDMAGSGQSSKIVAIVTPADASEKSVQWTSQDVKVATVSADGTVTSQGSGATTIIAKTVDGGHMAAVKVTVSPVAVTGLRLGKSTVTLGAGGQAETFSVQITPANATNKSVTWYSSDPSVARVDEQGRVTPLANGMTTISVRSVDGGHSASAGVTVVTRPTSVSLNKTSVTAIVGGQSVQLEATILPDKATDKRLIWQSSNTSIVVVDPSGVVTGVGSGTASVTARAVDGGASGSCIVKSIVPVSAVTISPASFSMVVGEARALITTISPGNATDKSVTWSSSDTSVAVVSASGVVTARASGSATIAVTTVDGQKQAHCKLTVGLPITSTLYGTAWGRDRFVAVGVDGTIITSLDGVSWKGVSSRTTRTLRSVSWNGSIFVAIGDGGIIITSSDGVAWTVRSSGSSENLHRIVWIGYQFVVVGNRNTLLASSDGVSWLPRQVEITSTIRDIDTDGSQLIAVGDFAYRGAVMMSADGVKWVSTTLSTVSSLYSVTWGQDKFVAAGGDGTVMTSDDGVNWTRRTNRSSWYTLFRVSWNGRQYVCVGGAAGFYRATTIITSPDGITWTQRTSDTAVTLHDVVWGNSQYVAVGINGTILTSNDGVVWTSRTASQ